MSDWLDVKELKSTNRPVIFLMADNSTQEHPFVKLVYSGAVEWGDNNKIKAWKHKYGESPAAPITKLNKQIEQLLKEFKYGKKGSRKQIRTILSPVEQEG